METSTLSHLMNKIKFTGLASCLVILAACEDGVQNAASTPKPVSNSTPGTTEPTTPSSTKYSVSVTKSGSTADTVTSNPSGINCGSDCSENFNGGATVVLTASPAANQQFTGWLGACTGTSTVCTLTMNRDANATATFGSIQRNLNASVFGAGTVSSNPDGINCGSDCSQRYEHGTAVSLIATANANQKFTGWTGDCSGSGACTVSMTADRNVSAAFTSTGVASTKFQGFGENVTGGTGGTVVTVTNLNNSGAGSLREAVSGSNRIVQFAVSGTIKLTSTLYVTGPNVTIDGFSAPNPGVTITGSGSFEVGGNSSGPTTKGSNVVIQGLRFRNVSDDAIRIAFNAHDVVVDHNSFAGSADGEVDVTEGAYNVTVSYNIFGKNKGPGPSLLSYDSSRVSYHHNIYFENVYRNPIVTSSFTRNYSTGPKHTDLVADVRHNIVWGYTLGTYVISAGGSVGTANIVNNLYSNYDGHPATAVVRDAYDSTTHADAHIGANVAIHDSRGCAYSHSKGSCINVTSTNSQNNHAEFAAPVVSGPSLNDKQGRLNEWLAVKNNAGVKPFPDDATDSEVRNAIIIPDMNIFTKVWND